MGGRDEGSVGWRGQLDCRRRPRRFPSEPPSIMKSTSNVWAHCLLLLLARFKFSREACLPPCPPTIHSRAHRLAQCRVRLRPTTPSRSPWLRPRTRRQSSVLPVSSVRSMLVGSGTCICVAVCAPISSRRIPSDEIDEQIRRERELNRRNKRPVRLLLLGQSESGKTATLKSASQCCTMSQPHDLIRIPVKTFSSLTHPANGLQSARLGARSCF
jgi:hypothetical protein